MKVRFYLENNKAVIAKERAIWCYVREYDETLALNTGERIKPELWDKRDQRANLRKTKDSILKGQLKSLNQYLNAFENKIVDIGRQVRMKDFSAKFSVISDEIKKQFDKRDTSIFSIYDEFIKIKKTSVSSDTLQKYKRMRSLLQDFEKSSRSKLNFEKITPLFFDKFYSFLIDEKQLLNNTAHKNIQFLKTFLIWCNTNGFTNNKSYTTFKSKSEKNEVIFLTEDELMSLYTLEIESDRLQRVRDLFVFQCFTGVRYSDLENLKREDIAGPTWKLRTQKTRDIIEIPLNGYALSILEKYREWPTPIPVISNQKFNKYIKELCKVAKINTPVKVVQYKGNQRIENTYKKYEVIGSHTARRTFISLSLQKGMSAEVIMSITGHTTYRMMQKYLKIADKQKRDEMDKVWGSNLRKIK